MRSVERMSDSPSSGSASRPAAVALLLLFLAGCATVDQGPPVTLASYIPGEHTGYLSVSPGSERFLAETLLGAFGFSEADASRIVTRTDHAYLGFGPQGRFTLAAAGRYPDGAIGRNLRRDGWEEAAASIGEVTWSHRSFPYAIVRLARDRYLVTTEEGIIGSPFSLAEAAGESFLMSSLAFYAPEPGGRLLRSVTRGGALPIQDVFVEFRAPASDRREVVATVTAASEQDARTLLVLTRLLVVGVLNAAGIGFEEIPETLSVERSEQIITIEGLFLREAQIARLFLERIPSQGGAP